MYASGVTSFSNEALYKLHEWICCKIGVFLHGKQNNVQAFWDVDFQIYFDISLVISGVNWTYTRLEIVSICMTLLLFWSLRRFRFVECLLDNLSQSYWGLIDECQLFSASYSRERARLWDKVAPVDMPNLTGVAHKIAYVDNFDK